jgi:putative thioredoxin
MTAEAVADVSDATFASEVIERSSELPVVVDFWAPWCGPCRVISPILERLADEYAGRVRLVKVNTDENPQVSTQYGISSIPAVMAFRDGAPASQFIGAVPEPQARAFFDSLLPTEADREAQAGEEARAAGDDATARSHFEAALESDRNHRRAALGLAALELEGGDLDRAEELASRWTKDAEGSRLLGLVRFRRGGGGDDRGELEGRLTADDRDAAAHYALGNLLAAEEEWAAALEHLLATVRLDRQLDDDGGRRRMLDLFNVLGEEHALTREYRQQLGGVLF